MRTSLHSVECAAVTAYSTECSEPNPRYLVVGEPGHPVDDFLARRNMGIELAQDPDGSEPHPVDQ